MARAYENKRNQRRGAAGNPEARGYSDMYNMDADTMGMITRMQQNAQQPQMDRQQMLKRGDMNRNKPQRSSSMRDRDPRAMMQQEPMLDDFIAMLGAAAQTVPMPEAQNLPGGIPMPSMADPRLMALRRMLQS